MLRVAGSVLLEMSTRALCCGETLLGTGGSRGWTAMGCVMSGTRWMSSIEAKTDTTSDAPKEPAATHSSSVSYKSACAMERLPVVMPERPQWEQEYAAWQEEFHAKRYKLIPEQFIEDSKEKRGEKKAAEVTWKAAERVTPADVHGDRKSLQRRLDQRIFLLVKQRNGEWGFVKSEIGEGDTSRGAAERAMRDAAGEDGYVPYFVGNMPAAHTVGENGDVVFYHRCQLISGKPAIDISKYEEYAWVAPDEFGEYFKDERVVDTLQKMA